METNLIPSAFLARPMKIVVIGAGYVDAEPDLESWSDRFL